jgi:Big-like domain-containing protein
MKRLVATCSIGLALVVAGCGNSGTKTLAFRLDGVPAKAAPGDNIAFTLSVVDGNGKAVSGYKGTVKFESTDATATLPANYTFTGGSSQKFNAQFKLPGKWALKASDATAPAPTGSAFLIVQGPASRLVKLSGDGQTGAAGAQLPQALVAQAIDDGGNPVAGVTVAWTTTMGGGTVTPASATTGDDGKATATATLGTSGPSYTFQAAVANLVGSPVVFTSQHGPFRLVYSDPTGGKLRLVKNAASTTTSVVLDLVVGTTAQTGYAAGFNLPIDDSKVKLASLTPGTALNPGSAPAAAKALLPASGPLKGVLVAAQSQKASGTGAVATDTALAAGAVIYTLTLDLLDSSAPGVVFDGTAAGFVLKSGGLRDKTGTAVVSPADVKIGKLEVQQ